MIYTHRVFCDIWERNKKPAFDPVFRRLGELKLGILEGFIRILSQLAAEARILKVRVSDARGG